MTLTKLVFKNLFRNPLRTLLTALAVACPMVIFVMCMNIVMLVTESTEGLKAQLRLLVQHRVTFTLLLPDSMRRDIEECDPTFQPGKGGEKIVAVSRMTWFGGKIGNKELPIQGLSVDPDTFPDVYADIGVTPEEREVWQLDRRAALVGTSISSYFGLQVGDTFRIKGDLPPYAELELKVVKLMPQDDHKQSVYFRRDYLDDAYKQLDRSRRIGTNIFTIRCTSPEVMSELSALIDQRFDKTEYQTRTQDEEQFQRMFIEMFGDFPTKLQWVALCVVGVISLAAINTMSLVFRERIRELATLKAVGFRARHIFFVVMAEGVLLAGLSGSAGALLPSVMVETGLVKTLILSIAHAMPEKSETVGTDKTADRDAADATGSSLAAERQTAGLSAAPAPAASPAPAISSSDNPRPASSADAGVNPIAYLFADMRINRGTVLIAIGISFLIGIAAGVFPAIRAVRLNTVDALKAIG